MNRFTCVIEFTHIHKSNTDCVQALVRVRLPVSIAGTREDLGSCWCETTDKHTVAVYPCLAQVGPSTLEPRCAGTSSWERVGQSVAAFCGPAAQTTAILVFWLGPEQVDAHMADGRFCPNDVFKCWFCDGVDVKLVTTQRWDVCNSQNPPAPDVTVTAKNGCPKWHDHCDSVHFVEHVLLVDMSDTGCSDVFGGVS